MSQPASTAGHQTAAWQRLAVGSWPVDRVLRRRAQDIVTKAALDRDFADAASLLDIGAGTGHLGEVLLERCPGLSCLAVDPSWRPVGRIEWRLAATGRHRFLQADGRALPLRDRAFDAVLIGFVLHHLEPGDQRRLLGEALRVLGPGGRLILLEDTPAGDAETARTVSADRRLNMEPPSSPHHYHTVPEWRALLTDLGLKIARESAFSRIFPPATIGAIPHHAFVSARI